MRPLAVVVNCVAQLLFVLKRLASTKCHAVQAFVRDGYGQTGLFAQGQIQIAPLITHTYGLDEMDKAMQTANENPAAIKVLLRTEDVGQR